MKVTVFKMTTVFGLILRLKGASRFASRITRFFVSPSGFLTANMFCPSTFLEVPPKAPKNPSRARKDRTVAAIRRITEYCGKMQAQMPAAAERIMNMKMSRFERMYAV